MPMKRATATTAAFLLAGLAFSASATAQGAEAARKPNLVLILADDMGYADAGFNGCKDIPTPGMDRIATEGVRFSNAYVTAAVCGPSRAGLITGRHQDRFGSSQNPTVDPSIPNGVPTSERNIAELLAPAGYTSMTVGKWHLGTYPGLHPQDRGFNEFFGFLTGGHNYLPEQLTLNDLSEVTSQWGWYRTKLLHNGARVETSKYLTDELSDKAVEFIDRPRTEDEPFFLYLCYNAPHTPMQATNEYLDRFQSIKDQRRRTYAAMVSAMDDGIARVLDALDKRQIADNTIVVFLSDNGGATNNASRNTPLRGHKSSPFEGGIRVPFVLRWPGVVEAGTTYDHPISSMDIAATIVAAAGPQAQAQIRETHPLDGVDLRPFLTGGAEGIPHEALHWRWFERGEAVVRLGDMKLISRPDSAGGEILFNLGQDMSERRNVLRSEEGDMLAGPLRAELERWMVDLVPPAYPSLGSWKFE